MPTSIYKLKDGRRVPGVTTVIGRFKNSDALIRWAWKEGSEGRTLYQKRDEAADIGSYVHALVEAHLKKLPKPDPGKLLPALVDSAHQGFDAFLTWKNQTRLTLRSLETPLVSELLEVGGTPDAEGEDEGGRLYMVDWKTSSGFFYDHLVQTSAYVEISQEVRGLDYEGIHVVRFGKAIQDDKGNWVGGGEFSHHYYPITHKAVELARDLFIDYRRAYDKDAMLAKMVR